MASATLTATRPQTPAEMEPYVLRRLEELRSGWAIRTLQELSKSAPEADEERSVCSDEEITFLYTDLVMFGRSRPDSTNRRYSSAHGSGQTRKPGSHNSDRHS